ncbi:MAG: hypothetical protein KDI28_07170 [Pseudomonadales bacterium]|nr:hypothetical protein [Pseudomonadales bacterium]
MKPSKPVYLLPFVLLWSLLYGVSGGVFYKLIAVYELWSSSNRLHVLQWKRYPQRSYRQFTSAVLMSRMGSRAWTGLPLAYSQVLQEFTRAPFPYLVILCNTVMALLYLPFALISGVFKGPAFVFRNTWGRPLIAHSAVSGLPS